MLIGFVVSGASFASGKAHWGYSGHEGPEYWGELSPDYAACSSGKNQSPVDLVNMVEGDLPELVIDYKAGGNEVVNNGHTIKINYAPGSTLTVEDKTFELKQFHYHTPSENTIEGRYYPMEAHFVHADKEGNLAVISVMYTIGDTNKELQKAWSQMPSDVGGKEKLKEVVDAKMLLPEKGGDYYRFNGSLTTPPCSEGVSWFVLKNADTASKEQVEKFSHVMHHDNNRPVQPINARVIIK
jgi:carbonic anhydrase